MMGADDGTPRSPSTHASVSCALCADVWSAIASLSAAGGRPPTFAEINAHLGGVYRGNGSLTNHVASLIDGGFLENRWRHRGLHVVRPLPLPVETTPPS